MSITVSREALEAAVDAIIADTLTSDFMCRDLDTLVAECGGGCEAKMAFLRAARDAGVDIAARLAVVKDAMDAASAP